jgi:hypothetical protein
MAGRPSDDDRLKAIRAHADGTMRYYATAYLRGTEQDRELMQAYMAITANFLALLDASSLDDRSMMSGRERIIQQYIEHARADPYEPGNCSFCGERPIAAWFEGPSFRTFVRSSAEVQAGSVAHLPGLSLPCRGERSRGAGGAKRRAAAAKG